MPRTTGIANFVDLRTPTNKDVNDAVTTRPPATANFFINSLDKRGGQKAGDFIISPDQSLFNGFFNRITVAEIVLDWGIPNVSPYWKNAQIRIQNTFTGTTVTLNFAQGFYTARNMLEEIVIKANAAFTLLGDPLQLALDLFSGSLGLVSVGVGNDPFQIINDSPTQRLARQIFTPAQLGTIAVPNPAPVGPSGFPTLIASSPKILGTSYVDIVSQQLTYNQDLKDNTTAAVKRDVLYRWYFAQDNVPPLYDQFLVEVPAGGGGAPAVQLLVPTNLPILQGYTPFLSRRTPPAPKQIAWSPEQPIGQVSFQVYDDFGRIIDPTDFAPAGIAEEGGNFNFQLSVLLSEN